MNNNFNDAKEHFIEKGYCQFSLKEFDIDFYNLLEEFLSCDENDNLKEIFYTFRFDSKNKNERYSSPSKSFEDAKEKQLKLLEECDDHSKISQCWYFQNDIDYISSFLKKKNPKFKDIDLVKKIKETTNNILKYFYENLNDENILHNELQFSFYDINNRFQSHSDGITKNICSILIYLNKNYNKDNGGILLLNDEDIIPELGTVALMDLRNHDIKHGVTNVTGGTGRYAIFNFPKLKNTI